MRSGPGELHCGALKPEQQQGRNPLDGFEMFKEWTVMTSPMCVHFIHKSLDRTLIMYVNIKCHRTQRKHDRGTLPQITGQVVHPSEHSDRRKITKPWGKARQTRDQQRLSAPPRAILISQHLTFTHHQYPAQYAVFRMWPLNDRFHGCRSQCDSGLQQPLPSARWVRGFGSHTGYGWCWRRLCVTLLQRVHAYKLRAERFCVSQW
jgi:hypothetical protein